MNFKRYQHIRRYNDGEVRDINIGTCYVFPKIDGTNSSVWLNEDGELRAGSRTRELTLENDNAGFYRDILKNENILKYLKAHPTHRLYGEWLVPHSLKTYRADAWRKFYIFDVCIDNIENGDSTGTEFIPYEIYQPMLYEFNLDYIPAIKIIKNGDYDNFIKCLEENIFLIENGAGFGEGVVIKNYDFYNKYGRQTWAKIVTSEFKEKHAKTMGAPVVTNKIIEETIVEDFVTVALIEKEYAKIVNDKGEWSSQYIPMLLEIVFHSLIEEEMWHILKKLKNPCINFKILKTLTINKIKKVKPEIFN